MFKLFTKKIKAPITKEDVMSFLKSNPLSEMEILNMLVGYLQDLSGETVDKAVEEKMFQDIAKIEGALDYMRITMNKDVQRHFAATTPMEQCLARGAYSRTAYWRGLMTKKNQEIKEPTKLDNKRYAK